MTRRSSGIPFLAKARNVLAREGFAGVFRRLGEAIGRMEEADYDRWAKARGRRIARLAGRNRRDAEALPWKPEFSVVLAGNAGTNVRESLAAQHYPHWKLHSPATRGDEAFFCLIEADGALAPNAFLEVAKTLNADPDIDMVYTDEDSIDSSGRQFAPFFKPDWSPDYLESIPYTGQLAVYRNALVQEVGGVRSAFGAAQGHDLALRVTERTDRIGHVAQVLFHRCAAGRNADVEERNRLALAERFARTGRRVRVEGRRPELIRRPTVSIVIPTAGGDRKVRGENLNLVTRCVERIRTASTYDNYDIVIVDNGDLRADVRRLLERFECRIVTFTDAAFNISIKLNLGAAHAKGEYLLLLNDDTEVINADWIEALLEQGTKPGVGAVGAKLLYEDCTIQHAGVAHHHGLPDHVRKRFPRDDVGYFRSTSAVRNYLAVTGACLLTPAAAFEQVGGFDKAFPINYGDIDYCLRLRERGLRTVYTPHAELYHYESASRDAVMAGEEEVRLFLKRWSRVTRRDPYYNAHYLRTAPLDYSLSLP